MSRPVISALSTYPEDQDKPFPNFRQPSIIGHFSLTGRREFVPDMSGLQYLAPAPAKPVRLDLDHNVELAVKPGPEKDEEGIRNLLRGILANKDKFSVEGELNSLHTDIVCFRGLLTEIMGTPYEKRDGWLIDVVRWKGTLYLMKVLTDKKKEEKMRETKRQKQMSSWGYKFEQLVTSAGPDTAPDTEAPVNENEEFCCLFRTRIAGVSVVYGAEMDAYKSNVRLKETDHIDPDKFVELKTSRIIDNDRQDRNFRKFKLLKWWSQSFLVGTRQLVCGWRDDSGVVEALETLAVREMPRSGLDWRPNVCVNFLASLLSALRSTITQDDLTSVHRLVWDPRSRRLEISKYSSDVEHILPSWYLNTLFK